METQIKGGGGMILMLAFLLIFHNECNASFTENYDFRFQIYRGNATVYTVEEVKKERLFEYPKSKESFIQVQTMWKNYYSCLRIKANEDDKPQIIRLAEGQFTEFQCDVCRKPFYNYEDLEWKYKPTFTHENMTEPEHLDLPAQMMLTPTKSLKIFNAIEDFSGLYVCYQRKNVISVYILEVSTNDTIEKVPYQTSNEVKRTITFEGADIEIYYKWDNWTECSLCGNVGRKFKYGSCFVSVPKTPRYFSDLKALSMFRGKDKLKYNDDHLRASHPNIIFKNRRTLEILEKFENGIPCASSILPEDLHKTAHEYPSLRAVVEHCLVTCQKSEIFIVYDRCGRVTEVANNTAGIYSAFQDLPNLPSETERISITGEFGKSVIFRCPGSLSTTAPITWKINGQMIFPEKIANESNGRFTIDLVNRIHIKKLRIKDSHVYSCWQRDKLAGTVYLNVDKRFKISFNHHVILMGMLIFLGLFLITLVKLA